MAHGLPPGPGTDMGIYDREYYRDESPGWYSVDGRRGTIGLIAATVGVFIAQTLTVDPNDAVGPVLRWLAFVSDGVFHGEVWRLVTAHFLSPPRTLFPIVFGMAVLFFCGRAVEELYGTREFLGFYLAAGLAVGVVLTAAAAVTNKPVLFLGTTGVVTAAMVLYAWHYPQRTILFLFVIPMPVWLLVSLLVGANAFGLFGGTGGPARPLAAVVGAGFALAYAKTGLRLTAWIPGLTAARGRPRLRVLADPPEDDGNEPVAAAAPPRPAAAPARRVDEQLEAKLDNVLEKVSRLGRDSLTPEERDILVRASEVYKKKRGV